MNIEHGLVAFLRMPNLCSAKKTKATSPLVDVFGGTPQIGIILPCEENLPA
jgi:hypothetical protein